MSDDDSMSVDSVFGDTEDPMEEADEIVQVVLTANSGNRYSVLAEPIGQGAFSNVYKGVNLETKEPVAIKFYITDDGKKQSANEYAILSKNLYGVCRVLEEPIIVDQEKVYLVMEFIRGKTLAHFVHSIMQNEWDCKSSMSVSRSIVTMMIQLIKIVDNLHVNDIQHRDLTAGNVMIRENYFTIVIIDFGQACFSKDCLTEEPADDTDENYLAQLLILLTTGFRGKNQKVLSDLIEHLKQGQDSSKLLEYLKQLNPTSPFRIFNVKC